MKQFPINIYRWVDNGYFPSAWGELKLDNDTLYVKLTCLEKDPFARYTHGPDAPVCRDSCMEFFFSLNGQTAYLNLEMNALGGYYCAFGPDRQRRTHYSPFTENGKPKATVESDRWIAEATLDMTAVKKLFGVDTVTALSANFYKCGDETEHPHYGMWNEVKWDHPDYHRPEFFADIPLSDIT